MTFIFFVLCSLTLIILTAIYSSHTAVSVYDSRTSMRNYLRQMKYASHDDPRIPSLVPSKPLISVWMTSKEPIPHLTPNVTRALFKGYDIRWHDDDALDNSMQELSKELDRHGVQGAYGAFQKLVPMAYKVDLWRYCLLWKYGGVYMDHELMLQMPLHDVLANTSGLVACSDRMVHQGIVPKVWNGFLACEAGNPIMLEAARLTIKNVENEVYNHPLDISGPGLLRQAIRNADPTFKVLCDKKVQFGWSIFEIWCSICKDE